MKKIFLGLGILVLISLSPSQISAEEQFINNFELTFMIYNNSDFIKFTNYIKSALIPLGIDVNIVVKDFWAFAATVKHVVNTEPWDIALIVWQDFSSMSPIHEHFHSGFGINSSTFRLGSPEWQEWQLQDTGVNQTEVDELIDDYQFAPDVQTSIERADEFSEIYMSKLLYQFPLLKIQSYWYARNGLDGFDPNLGLIPSLALGAHWEDNPEYRENDNSTLLMNLGEIRDGFAHGFRGVEGRLVIVDEDLSVHPDIAIQWEKSDWLVNNTVIKGGKHKFWLRDDAYWANTEGLVVDNKTGPFRITPGDFAFGLHIRNIQSRVACDGRDKYITEICSPQYAGIEINETENTLTLYNSRPSFIDIDTYARQLYPLPEFYLNKTLSYLFDPSLTGTADQLYQFGIPILYTSEFIEFFGDMQSTSGPYHFTSNALIQNSQGLYNLKLRDDYWYPNEWDSPNQDFIVHEPGPEDAKYNTYNASSNASFRKPTQFAIKNLIVPLATHPLFEEIDFGGKIFDLTIVNKFRGDPNFELIPYRSDISARNLAFNLQNEHLKKFNVRKAIASIIDKQALARTANFDYITQDSPFWPNDILYYNDNYKIEYSYSTARDLMRSEGYTAAEQNIFPIDQLTSPSINIIVDAPINLGFVMMALIITAFNKKRKSYVQK